MTRRGWALAVVAVIASGAGVVWWQFQTDITAARRRVSTDSTVIDTPCGTIEYQEAGTGVPLLAVHGGGGGYDQGMAFAAPLATRGVRVIAMSRFGYLGTPMPKDASAEAQAAAFVCLLDRLGIDKAAVMGGSAGAPSAMQMAIRHPDRVSALVLLVPVAWKPPSVADSAVPIAPFVDAVMMRAIGSDLLFWSLLHLAPTWLTGTVLGTPPDVLGSASASEKARIGAVLEGILPVAGRAAGMRGDTTTLQTLKEADLARVTVPTLIFSARDDRFGTFAAAEYTASQIDGARFFGFDSGGHALVGHNDEVIAAILDLLIPPTVSPGP